MRKLKLAYLLAFAPMLMGADDDFASLQNGLVVNSLPTCADDEYLTYTSSGLACTAITAGSLSVPDCQKDGQLLTFTMTGEIGVFSCTPKGSESLSASDITTINNKYTDLTNLETQIRNLESGMRTPAAKFCGLYTNATNQNGRITATSGAVGLLGAAELCAGVTTCGTGARMCSVYDMFNSVATGTVKSTDLIAKSWVYMASWQISNVAGEQEPTAGLGDNCGSFTYPTHDRKWDGTAVQFAALASGEHVLKFFTGDTDGLCSQRLPIACCR